MLIHGINAEYSFLLNNERMFSKSKSNDIFLTILGKESIHASLSPVVSNTIKWKDVIFYKFSITNPSKRETGMVKMKLSSNYDLEFKDGSLINIDSGKTYLTNKIFAEFNDLEIIPAESTLNLAFAIIINENTENSFAIKQLSLTCKFIDDNDPYFCGLDGCNTNTCFINIEQENIIKTINGSKITFENKGTIDSTPLSYRYVIPSSIDPSTISIESYINGVPKTIEYRSLGRNLLFKIPSLKASTVEEETILKINIIS